MMFTWVLSKLWYYWLSFKVLSYAHFAFCIMIYKGYSMTYCYYPTCCKLLQVLNIWIKLRLSIRYIRLQLPYKPSTEMPDEILDIVLLVSVFSSSFIIAGNVWGVHGFCACLAFMWAPKDSKVLWFHSEDLQCPK